MYNYRPRDGPPRPYMGGPGGAHAPEWGTRSLDLDVRLTPVQTFVGMYPI